MQAAGRLFIRNRLWMRFALIGQSLTPFADPRSTPVYALPPRKSR